MRSLEVDEEVRTKPAYLHTQLPLVMASDRGLARFLRGLDEMASELYERVGQKEHLFDVGLAPLPVVRLLAAQIGVPIDPFLPAADQRQIARVAAATFPIRGTRESLERNLAALTGSSVSIEDPSRIVADGTPRAAVPPSARSHGPGTPAMDTGAAMEAETMTGAETTPSAATTDTDGDASSDPGEGDRRRMITIRLGGMGRATSASVRAVVRRELDCSVAAEFDPPLPDPEEGGA